MRYDGMNRSELIGICNQKDNEILSLTNSLAQIIHGIYNKEDIKAMYKCENDKALRILKILFHMGYANKIGKEYYISAKRFDDFMSDTTGVCVHI